MSHYLVVEPGDLINTGTPAGVALDQPDQPCLRHGAAVTLEDDGLGQAGQRLMAAL
ncbi:MAG TPA: fumarylacetoacetate hydrolase family protein [Streptosporangiaceae bacterium]|jgi:2-keto-4-pentenoate hydratase/2-oxohepta-3-ene-1,7-dioic acid hydratase in catechol pathway